MEVEVEDQNIDQGGDGVDVRLGLVGNSNRIRHLIRSVLDHYEIHLWRAACRFSVIATINDCMGFSAKDK